MTFKMDDSPDLPLGKIILGITLVAVVFGVGLKWYSDAESEKRADALLVQAQDYFRLSELDAGLLKIDQALKLKEKPDYLRLKVNLLANKNKVFEANETLDRLIRYEPKNAHYRYLSSTFALNEDNLPQSVQRMQEATQLEPTNAFYQVSLANILMRQDKISDATGIYETLVTRDPQYKYAWNQYASALSNQGAYLKAVSVEQRALKAFPKDSDFFFLYATTLDLMGKKPEAVSAYRRSLELQPLASSIAAKRIFEITGQHVPPALEQMTNDQISFEPDNKLMFVRATVNGEPGRFLLDTGASVSVIYQSKAARYHLTPSPFKNAVETAGGIIQVPITYGDVSLDRQHESPVVFGVIPDPKRMDADGIIGMNFLEHFRMEIDRPAQIITLTR